MAVTNYYSVGDEILGEETGGVRKDYLTDALGSVTATVTSTGVIENTYRYKPYGAELSKTGAGSDSNFAWVGGHGYRQTKRVFGDVYVRARHYATGLGRWNTKDPLGYLDGINFYLYVNSSPSTVVDSSGLCVSCCCCPDSVTIGNVRDLDSYQGVNSYGNYFDVTFVYTSHVIKANEVAGDCTLKWKELTDVPYDSHMPAKIWTDMYAIIPKSPTLKNWNDRKKPCPGQSQTKPITDVPSFDPIPGLTISRYLCFRIVLEKTPGCQCARSSVVATAKQFLKVKNGMKVERSFKFPFTGGECTHTGPD